MLRAALYSALLASLSAGWLKTHGVRCRITLDQNLALIGLMCGALGAGTFTLLAGAKWLTHWCDERRSRAWRLP
jgi:hypothetical protein